jgi:hypothetical protein
VGITEAKQLIIQDRHSLHKWSQYQDVDRHPNDEFDAYLAQFTEIKGFNLNKINPDISENQKLNTDTQNSMPNNQFA